VPGSRWIIAEADKSSNRRSWRALVQVRELKCAVVQSLTNALSHEVDRQQLGMPAFSCSALKCRDIGDRFDAIKVRPSTQRRHRDA
jgi:hypothetical protein